MMRAKRPGMDRSTSLRICALMAPVAVFLGAYSVHHPDELLITPDSASYLEFTPIRTGGYPFFLAVLKPFIRDPADYAGAQLVLYALAVMAFGQQLLSTYRNPLICLVGTSVLLTNLVVNRLHFVIMTESVFLSTSALFLAAALAHLRTGSWRTLAAAAGLAGCAMAIRPTGMIFVAALIVLLAAGPDVSRQVWKRLTAAVVPLVAVLGAEAVYYHAHHPGPRESLLPIQILGKAGMVDVNRPQELIDGAPAESKPLQAALELELAPVRSLIRGAPSIASRCRLAAQYEMFVEYRFAPAERAQLLAVAGDNGLTSAGLARLERGLPDYLRLTADYFFCLVTLGVTDNDDKAAFAAYLDAHRPLPFENEVLLGTSASPRFALLVQAGLLAGAALLAAAGICLIATLCLRRSPTLELAMGGLCGVIVHGVLLLSALAGAGIPRYTLGLWPPLAAGLAFSGLWIGSLVGPIKWAQRRQVSEQLSS
jgi:hypothetical protein